MARLHTLFPIGSLASSLTAWGAPLPIQAQESGPTQPSTQPVIQRLAGATRYETAAAVASRTADYWPSPPCVCGSCAATGPLTRSRRAPAGSS